MNNDEALQALAHLVDTPYEPGVKATISALTEPHSCGRPQ